MKKFITILAIIVTWYGIFSFIMWDTNFQVWHWLARLMFVLITIYAISNTIKDPNL